MKVINDCFKNCLFKIGEQTLYLNLKTGEGPALDEDALRFQETLGMKDGVFGNPHGNGAMNLCRPYDRHQFRHLSQTDAVRLSR